MAEALSKYVDEIVQDYTATLVKHERIGGQLAEPEVMFTKVRHQQTGPGRKPVPFSVYMRFLSPERIKGRFQTDYGVPRGWTQHAVDRCTPRCNAGIGVFSVRG